ncbi:MAG: DUF6745 domain-containing protein [Planctomycetales bacterium]
MAKTITPEVAYGLLESGNVRPGLVVAGMLDYSRRRAAKATRDLPPELPQNLTIDFLNLADSSIERLPSGLVVQELDLSGTAVRELPEDLNVRTRLNLSGCDLLEVLPQDLKVGALNVAGCTGLRGLPEGLDVWFLNVSGCWALETWPERAQIRCGQLLLRNCTALRGLPWYIQRLSALDVRDCPNLTTLPEGLQVTGWLDVARSGLTEESSLPPSLARTQLRWGGVNIDRRIAFHPETLSVDEVLGEKNAERRRVLLERYGYGRFLKDAQAELLDADRDPGGPRQLLRVELPGDEPLVALSCFCPSTARQYMLRVPPTMTSCHQAAAWIAGFDNPADYHPVLET